MSVIVDSSGNPVFSSSGGGAFTPGAGGSSGTLLTASDFTYLGMFGAPADTGAGDSWGFHRQRGSLTGRYVAGQLRLLMTGTGDGPSNGYNGFHLYEIVPPASYGTDPTIAPVATFLKNWGPLSAWRYIVDTNGATVAGLLWDASRNAVWYAYHANYNVAGWNDPSIGVVVLNDGAGTTASYGAWRTSTGSKKTGGFMYQIPQAFADTYFGGNTMGMGAHTTSGNATTAWGPALQAAPFLADYLTRPPDDLETTPGESVPNGPSGPQPRASITTLDVMWHPYAHPKARHIAAEFYRNCGWGTTPGTNVPGEPPYLCANGYWDLPAAQVWNSLDSAFTGVWIDTPTKKGMLYFPRITVPNATYPIVHQWYSPGDCCHGHHDIRKADSTPGDQNSSMRNFMLIYDPQVFIDRYSVPKQPYELLETHIIDMHDTFFSGISEWADDAYKIDGSWFDVTTRKLYVVKGDRDYRYGGSPGRPMIYVFGVAA